MAYDQLDERKLQVYMLWFKTIWAELLKAWLALTIG